MSSVMWPACLQLQWERLSAFIVFGDADTQSYVSDYKMPTLNRHGVLALLYTTGMYRLYIPKGNVILKIALVDEQFLNTPLENKKKESPAFASLVHLMCSQDTDCNHW